MKCVITVGFGSEVVLPFVNRPRRHNSSVLSAMPASLPMLTIML